MTSKSVKEGRYLKPPNPGSPPFQPAPIPTTTTSQQPARRRQANVYDAVAGRVTTRHALGTRPPDDDDKPTTLRDSVLAPDEVLFARAGAPTRFAERDIYCADERLPRGGAGILPDSDLLSAVHLYASQYYDALGAEAEARGADMKGGKMRHVDERSMDETALLAFGILLEEAGREVLGRRGDMVFTEGLLEDEEEIEAPVREESVAASERDQTPRAESRLPSRPKSQPISKSRDGTIGHMEGEALYKRPWPKRRKPNEATSKPGFR